MLVGKSGQAWVRGTHKLRHDKQCHMRESHWQREQLVQRPEQGCFSNSREARGLHQGMEGVVAEDRGSKTKGSKDPGLLPE